MASKLKPGSLIARWVESEAIAQKMLGLSFAKIAENISRAGRGELVPATPRPEGVRFPEGYSISSQGVQRAYNLAMTREGRLKAAQMRDLDTDRTEEWILKLQTGIQAGDPQSISTATGILRFRMRAHGYALERDAAKKRGEDFYPDEGAEDEAFEMEVLRAMTNEESEIVGEIMLRARQRVKERRAGLVPIEATGTRVARVTGYAAIEDGTGKPKNLHE